MSTVEIVPAAVIEKRTTSFPASVGRVFSARS
jgi:hypothetical protein